uniref:Ionotropic receptor n=1 Tax=Histia rhodope TaxID=1453155 RepID=A0A7G4KBX5_9NEOP|nr:ionotropic receptor [Histia rhodope]
MVANGRAVFRSFTSDRDFLPTVKAGAVLVKEQTAVDHLMYFDYLTKVREGVVEEERCTYVVAPNAFMKRTRAFAFPMNTNLTTLFDPILTYLLQSGIVDFLEHRDLPTTKICPLDLQSKDRRLRNSDLMMTYMIMGVGLASAIAVFIIEMILKRYAVKHKLKPLKKFNSKTFTFKDDSMPPPYDSLFGKNSKYRGSKRTVVNGREYWETKMKDGTTRLIPLRTPSALLYQ